MWKDHPRAAEHEQEVSKHHMDLHDDVFSIESLMYTKESKYGHTFEEV
jgi:hypothetical protein